MNWKKFNSRMLGIIEFKRELQESLDDCGTEKFSKEQLSYLNKLIETSYWVYYNKAVQTNLHNKEPF